MKEALKNIAGEENFFDDERLDGYSIDGIRPRCAVFPDTTEKVSEIMKLASKDRLSVIPGGSGTKLHIGNIPLSFDILLSLKKLNKMLYYNPDDLVAACEAGMKVSAFNSEVTGNGLWLPIDPPFADLCTLGGVTASDSNGMLRQRYGKVKNMITGMKMVFPDGSIVKTGSRLVKNSAGYNLSRLLAGSYGTLGIITEINIKLEPKYESRKSAVLGFDDLSDFTGFAGKVRESFLIPSYIECVSTSFADAVDNAELKKFRENKYMCLIGFEGFAAAVDWQMEQIKKMGAENNCRRADYTEETANALSSGIRDFPSLFSGSLIIKTGVPVSEFKGVINEITGVIQDSDVENITLSHFGSGVIYSIIPLEENISEDTIAGLIKRIMDCSDGTDGSALVERVRLNVKKSVSVWGKTDNITIMKKIKEQFDPQNLLSPGRFAGGI